MSAQDVDDNEASYSPQGDQPLTTQHESSPQQTILRRNSTKTRFAEGTKGPPPESMGRNRVNDPSPDEIVPIRPTQENVSRSYNTIEATGQQTSLRKPTRSSPVGEDRGTVEEPNGDGDKDTQSWYKRVADKYGSVTLDNKGSVARDHLALERTFLAWLRTSLAFASIGIAVTQLFRLNTSLASRAKRSVGRIGGQTLPFSPLMGPSVPDEVVSFLQQVVLRDLPSSAEPTLGPTLLDQLLSLSPDGTPVESFPLSDPAFEMMASSTSKLQHLGKPLGATFIGISIVVLLVGFHRYFEAQHWIIRGKFPASRGSIALVGFIAGALIIASLVVVIVVDPTQYEKR